MTEILTESFCERCGTRYTFESSAPRMSRLGRVRTLSKGVRNFVMSDESSFSEAMAEARGEEEIAATSHQLDAFHQTFNFCLTCRQYTCGDCWNQPEGRCLTCAPVPGQEEAAQVLTASLATAAFEPIADANGHEEEVPGIEAWPEMDLPAERLARVMEPPPAIAAAATAAVTDEVESDLEVLEAVDVPERSEPDVAEALGASEGAASQAPPGVVGVAPGQSLEEAIAAYEAALASEELGAEPTGGAVPLEPPAPTEPGAEQAAPLVESGAVPAAAAAAGESAEPVSVPPDVKPPVAASLAAAGLAAVAASPEAARSSEGQPQPEPEPVAAEPEPVAAEPEPVAAEPEPVAAEPEPVAAEPEPVAAEPEPVAAGASPEASPADHVEQPTWPVPPSTPLSRDAGPAPAPNQPPAPAPWLTVAPEDAPPPEWPTAPAWAGPANGRDVPMTLAGRPLLPQGDAAALWAASAKEVLGATPAPFGAAPRPLAASGPAPQAQPCVSCGLSLSANARFCRRCGSRQA